MTFRQGDDCNVGPVDVAEGAAARVINPGGFDLTVVEAARLATAG
jgi:hypothetical protein